MPIGTLKELYELRDKIDKAIDDSNKYGILLRAFHIEIERRIAIKEKEAFKHE